MVKSTPVGLPGLNEFSRELERATWLSGRVRNIPRSGMTPEHFRVIQQAAQRLQVDIIMRLTNTASTPLIELGCPGKPLEVKPAPTRAPAWQPARNPENSRQPTIAVTTSWMPISWPGAR